ncbi:uncharacterized protein CELE_B0379.1 [Caenorhabditis elegans]|uniref:Uncharacterized protein n=1 Tax=Caenorhabditis elegans TaxID=6239 RepID=Q9XU45_CAEEL|nr:Uncharacterized protein CELE_B0379.1 [Caenorhabditis elegans]CAB05896.1 Uncharacterized protein CELE_B0379.1 [Caenorhabditis elegans]|eukprot:NP_001251292.1 Uncharacterized protein CELE_B0379.1 [Caenorhabditis elegans]
MGAFDRVKAQVASDSKWTSAPYKGFVAGSPSNTYIDIVSTAFEDATNTMNFARHSKYDEMYSPYLGSFRERHNYTSIAPSLCINKTNRAIEYDLAPHKAYNPRQSEWLLEKDKKYRVRGARNLIYTKSASDISLPPLTRRTFTVPTDTLRHQNQFLYWNGRALGLDYVAPFLRREDYSRHEDRRYQRIYWSPHFIDLLPSCRHSAHLMLSAY